MKTPIILADNQDGRPPLDKDAMKNTRDAIPPFSAAHCYAAPLDLNHPAANMFGCFPCPVCKSIYRWPTQQGTVRCDDCGLVQELENTEQHNDIKVISRPILTQDIISK